MKHGSVLTQSESRRICLFWLNAAAVVGIIIGAVIAVSLQNKANVWLHQFFSPLYSGNTVFEVFKNTYLSSIMFLAVIFLLGLSSVGQPIGIGLLVCRGIGIGFSVAGMYQYMGFKAVLPVLILVIPKAMAICFLASLAVREMLKLSCSQFRYLFKDVVQENKNNRAFRLYCIKFVVIAAIMFFVSVLDSALNYIFMDLI